MAFFKYKDGQVHEYKDPQDIVFLSNHPDFVEVKEAPKQEEAKTPVAKKRV
jgi:hypothetical protein